MEPPRHGKSDLCSHYLPAWYLAARPDNRVLLASYEADFAASWGRKVRDTVEAFGPKYYGINVDKRSSAADEWQLEGRRGGMNTAGVGGALTGRGGNLLVVDDPVKNSQDAQSAILREKQYNWYRTTFRTRLEPDGIIVIIGTRWHEDDLIGRIIRDMGEDDEADQFIIVRLPALAEPPSEDYPDPDILGREPGEPLFPERFDKPKLIAARATVGEYAWNALYQQRPAPLEGGMFQKDWFDVVPMPAIKMKKTVRRWDFASTDVKKGEDPDYTVGLKVGLGYDGLFYILDMVRVRESPGMLDKTLRRTLQQDGKLIRQRSEQEPGSSGKIAVWHLARGPFLGYSYRGIRSTGPKILRAETVAAAVERGEYKLVRGRWNKDFLREVSRFPNDVHDDIVDALAGAHEDLTKRLSKMVTF